MNSLVWFKNDLRLLNNKALYHAAKKGPVIALYMVNEKSIGSAQKWWLHHSLQSLSQDLKKHNIDLLLRPSSENIIDIAEETNSSSVFWNRRYDPQSIAKDSFIKKELKNKGVHVQSFNSSYLIEPENIKNKQGGVFKVFTPFWNHVLKTLPPQQLLIFECRQEKGKSYPSHSRESFNLLPQNPNWASQFSKMWEVGEHSVLERLHHFLENNLSSYNTNRDYPSINGTSKLSPHLHFGEISPEQILYQQPEYGQFLNEIGWREFCNYLLYHFPHILHEPLNPKFKNFPWKNDEADFKAWTMGLTGFPLVDAGMRQLWKTGWMHNRVRMVTASFLTKHLLISWQKGAEWFYDTLLDADLASNAAGWQWVAGCGADAAPYFRIFNPITQSQKFDSSGDYIRTWLPELKNVPLKYIHEPWKYEYSIDYPKPIIDHNFARLRALDAYASLKNV